MAGFIGDSQLDRLLKTCSVCNKHYGSGIVDWDTNISMHESCYYNEQERHAYVIKCCKTWRDEEAEGKLKWNPFKKAYYYYVEDRLFTHINKNPITHCPFCGKRIG
jgi:hypothetical protein